MSNVDVRFVSTRGIVLPVEVFGAEGSLPVLQQVLFALRVQVLRIEESLSEGRPLHILSLCEFDGGPLRSRRRRVIAEELKGALSSLVGARGVGSHPGLASAKPANEKGGLVAA